MAEEIDENEFFQQDFTTATEWEIFNARLEEVFHEWKLPLIEVKPKLKLNELYLCEWEIKSEIIFFADVELKVNYYRAIISNETDNKNEGKESPQPSTSRDSKQNLEEDSFEKSQTHVDLMNLNNNFCIFDYKVNKNKIHPLAVWYGIREFVIIEPVESICNESQIRVLLSSICITITESNTKIPVFVHVKEKELNVFLGVCEIPGIRIHLDIVALETIPPYCKYLSGLLYMFKEKFKTVYLNPITVSVRFEYSVSDFINTNFSLEGKIPFTLDYYNDESDEDSTATKNNFYALPFGVSIDPIKELKLYCTWPEIYENVIVDSATYSDLDPMLAPIWSIGINLKDQSIYYLTDTVNEYLKLSENNRTLASIVGNNYVLGGTQNFEGENPLNLLTESKIPSLISVLPSNLRKVSGKKSSNKSDGPISIEELMQMLYYMFPDAQEDSLHPYGSMDNDKYDPCRIKSAVPDSLVFRLSLLLATCYSYFGGIQGLGQLWAEFTQEMRYRVERCIQIPGVSSGFPDSRTCLLHQKLQMLNICMERRRLREGGLPFSMTSSTSVDEQQEESDDEFYDCSDTNDEDYNSTTNDDKNDIPPWNKPVGRLLKFGNLKLINSNEPLYVPITQEPVPKTEDQLEDDAEVMLKLGPGSELCTQIMSASLLSDMESFKAANPNAKFEDFMRWYSPRDWIEETDENGMTEGHLSERMLIPGNTWLSVWSTAKPVPARRQRRLFDDTKEAEKVLHYFETRTIGQIFQLTISSIFHSIFLKIKAELHKTNLLDEYKENIEKILTNLCKLSRENWLLADQVLPHQISSFKKWEILLNEISFLEQQCLISKSLAYKLFDCTNDKLNDAQKSIILPLLKGYEAIIHNGSKNDMSARILDIFSDARQSKNEFFSSDENQSQLYLPQPIRKEYILRVDGKTTDKGIFGPQFLRAIIDKNIRLCGAFSQDTIFFID